MAFMMESAFDGANRALLVSLAEDRGPDWPARDGDSALVLDMSHKHHRGFWAMQLDKAARSASEPHILVARGLACLAVVRWAQLSPRSYVQNIAGACLFSPLSFTPAQAALAQTLQPSPTLPLPFGSVVVEGRASPLIGNVLALVDSWGSRFIDSADFAVTDTGLSHGHEAQPLRMLRAAL